MANNMEEYQSGHYLGLRLTPEQDQRLKDFAWEMYNWYPAEQYPLSKEEVFSLLILLGYHMEITVPSEIMKSDNPDK